MDEWRSRCDGGRAGSRARQEAGRAGRYGQPADCLRLWSRGDFGLLVHFIARMGDQADKDVAGQGYRAVKKLVETEARRMRRICEYFGETPKSWDNCGNCDTCAGLPDWLQRDDGQSARDFIYKVEADDSELRALKSWRRDFARRLFSELLLRPVTVEDIPLVPGIGRQKARKYGEEILAALFAAIESRWSSRANPASRPPKPIY